LTTPPPADFDHPNPARVYECLRGGYDHFAADREEAERLLEICPELRDMVSENRAFIARAVTWAANQGVRQFADLGAGMPASPAVHEMARAVLPQARVAYADIDPVAVRHMQAVRALEGWGEGTAVTEADLTDPAAVLKDPAVRAVIDPAEPVCVILGLVLGTMPAWQAREVVTEYADLVAPGSLVVISCARFDDESMWKELSAAYTAADSYNHAPAEIAGFLDGLEVVPPGLVAAQNWRGGWHDVPVTPPGPAYVLAGVARKP
jgi:S-adenosyl methyltransferase